MINEMFVHHQMSPRWLILLCDRIRIVLARRGTRNGLDENVRGRRLQGVGAYPEGLHTDHVRGLLLAFLERVHLVMAGIRPTTESSGGVR